MLPAVEPGEYLPVFSPYSFGTSISKSAPRWLTRDDHPIVGRIALASFDAYLARRFVSECRIQAQPSRMAAIPPTFKDLVTKQLCAFPSGPLVDGRWRPPSCTVCDRPDARKGRCFPPTHFVFAQPTSPGSIFARAAVSPLNEAPCSLRTPAACFRYSFISYNGTKVPEPKRDEAKV